MFFLYGWGGCCVMENPLIFSPFRLRDAKPASSNSDSRAAMMWHDTPLPKRLMWHTRPYVVTFRDCHQHVVAVHFPARAQVATASVVPTMALALPPAPLGHSSLCCRTHHDPRRFSPPVPFRPCRPWPLPSPLAKVQCHLSLPVDNRNAKTGLQGWSKILP